MPVVVKDQVKLDIPQHRRESLIVGWSIPVRRNGATLRPLREGLGNWKTGISVLMAEHRQRAVLSNGRNIPGIAAISAVLVLVAGILAAVDHHWTQAAIALMFALVGALVSRYVWMNMRA